MTALNLIKCFKQIKEQRVALTFVPFSELPSNISTMDPTIKKKDPDLANAPIFLYTKKYFDIFKLLFSQPRVLNNIV